MSEELKVCLLNDSFPPVIDGVANTVKNYASVINKNHGKAVVAVPYYPGADDSGFEYKVVRYPSLNTEKIINYRAGYPFSFETLEALKSEDINIIHTHCPFASAFLARTLRKVLDAPVIFTYHTKFDVDIKRAVGSRYIREKVIEQLVRNIESCDEVWVVSEGAGENLKSLGYKGEYVIMQNGVDIPKGRVSEEKIAAATDGFDLGKDVPVFLFVGRMVWYKGLDIIIDSLAEIKECGDDFRMVFIGGGLDIEEVKQSAEEKGISEKCIFTGAIRDREVMKAWYCRADLFIFPSVYDTNGLVVREAAACGLGSILVEGSCAAEGITDGETGFLCEKSAKAFSRKLHYLCKNREEMKKVGENAMEKIYISWEDSVKNAAERYKTVLKNYREGKYKNKEITFEEEWLRTEGEFLDSISRAKKRRKDFQKEIQNYGKEIYKDSIIAAKSFNNRRIKLKNKAKEKSRKIKGDFLQKIDRYL